MLTSTSHERGSQSFLFLTACEVSDIHSNVVDCRPCIARSQHGNFRPRLAPPPPKGAKAPVHPPCPSPRDPQSAQRQRTTLTGARSTRVTAAPPARRPESPPCPRPPPFPLPSTPNPIPPPRHPDGELPQPASPGAPPPRRADRRRSKRSASSAASAAGSPLPPSLTSLEAGAQRPACSCPPSACAAPPRAGGPSRPARRQTCPSFPAAASRGCPSAMRR